MTPQDRPSWTCGNCRVTYQIAEPWRKDTEQTFCHCGLRHWHSQKGHGAPVSMGVRPDVIANWLGVEE